MLISPVLQMEEAQFIVNVLNEIPLPGLDNKDLALRVQVAFKAAEPYEPETTEEDQPPETPPEEFSGDPEPDVVE